MIFLDSARVDDITAWLPTGVVKGVTTNPTLLARHTTPDRWPQAIKDILAAVGSLPVAFEVTTCVAEDMLHEARELAALGAHTVVKVPLHDAADPPRHFLDVVRRLTDEGVAVNVTAVMSAQQALAAALAGARYVSLFAGRVADRGGDPAGELGRARTLLDRSDRPCELIAASTRHPGNITEWLLAGADVVTVKPALLAAAVHDTGTSAVVDQFMADCRAVGP
ncbi:transaldolase family protein [Streptomyces sp. NPDC054784]